jgi:hypothetical protein
VTVKAHPAVVAAAVLLVVALCGTGAFSLLSEAVTGTVERTNAFTPAGDRLVIDADGDVTIGPSADGRVHVQTVVRHGLGRPEIVQESTAAGVRLDAGCREFLAVRCDVRHEVRVPPAFQVTIDGADGDIAASGLSGALTVDRSTGDITVVELSGPLDLRTRDGRITGSTLRSEAARAATDHGDVLLELLTPPRSVEVDTTAGDVDLAVPGDTTYRIDVTTDDGVLVLPLGAGATDWSDDRIDGGEVQVAVPYDRASPRVLRVASDVGDTTIRPSR